jgi:hypothetical protein
MRWPKRSMLAVLSACLATTLTAADGVNDRQASVPVVTRKSVGPRTAFPVEPSDRVQETSANPKVQPGVVNWHTSFAEALTAARKSGKPVLLFQMMGKLDDQFC